MTAVIVRRLLYACLIAGLVSWSMLLGPTALASSLTGAAPRALTSTEYGYSVSIAGQIAVVGAPGFNQGEGAVYVFERSGAKWRDVAKLYDPARRAQDAFGWSVAVVSTKTGAYLAVGEACCNGNVTRDIAYVYTRSGRKWHRQATLRDPLGYYADNFGGAVALTSSTLVIGASLANNLEGAAYIYSRSAKTWTRRATFRDPHRNFGDYFGNAVAVSGNTAVVTASGIAYAYSTRDGRHWSRSAVIMNPADPSDNFGASVAIYRHTAVIGAPGDGMTFSQGAAYVFGQSGARWKAQARLISPNGITDDDFGGAVSIFGERVLVGAPVNGRGNCGAAYDFHRKKAAWHLKLTLRIPKCQPGDQFGWSTAVSGATGIIGAPAQNRAYLKVGLP